MNFLKELAKDALGELGHFIRDHFDKLLLVGLFIYMTGVLLHMSHDAMDIADVSWAREQSNLIIGALLGLITGAVLRNGGRNTPQDPPTPTP